MSHPTGEPLSKSELYGEKPNESKEVGGEEARKTLALLTKHLDDELLEIEHNDFSHHSAYHVTIFQAWDKKKSSLFLLVSNSGEVSLGWVKNFKKTVVTQRLEGFSNLWDQVVSVNVTGLHRYTGTSVDVLIAVNQSHYQNDQNENTEVVDTHIQNGVITEKEYDVKQFIYHGVAGVDESDRLFLEPVTDRFKEPQPGEWRREPPDRMPEWLLSWHYGCAPNIDPFAPSPDKVLENLKRTDQKSQQNIGQVYRTESYLIYTEADTIFVIPTTGTRLGEEDELTMPSWISAVTFFETDDTLVGLLACEDRHLVGLRYTPDPDKKKGGGFQLDFFHFCDESPVSVAFTDEKGEASIYPDVLVAFSNGRLSRFTYHGKQQLEKLWRQQWQVLDAVDFEAKKALYLQEKSRQGEELDTNLEWRKALLIGLMRDLAQESYRQRPKTTDILELFGANESEDVLFAGINELVEGIAQLHRKKHLDHGPLNEKADNLLKVAWEVYFYNPSIRVQFEFDHLFRTLNLKFDKVTDNVLQQFIKGSLRNREDIWLQKRPESWYYRNAKQVEKNRLMYRLALGMERWADAYWEADTFRLREARKRAVVDIFCLDIETDGKKQTWLGVAKRNEILFFPFTRPLVDGEELSAKPTFDPIKIKEPFKNDAIQCIASLPGDKPQLLIGGASGMLYLYQFDPHASEEKHQCRLMDYQDFGGLGLPRTLCQIQSKHQGIVAAAAYNKGRTSHLVMLRVRGQGFQDVKQHALGLAKVRFLDLACSGSNQFLLLMGGAFGPAGRICKLDETFNILHQFWMHENVSGTQALCFDRQHQPQFAMTTERNGFVWGAEVPFKTECRHPQSITDYLWAFCFSKSVRAAVAVQHGRDSHFLLGTEGGELVLLRAKDGHRIWKHRLFRPIEKMTKIHQDGSLVAIAMRGGWIALFSHNDNPPETLSQIKSDLQKLNNNGWTYEEVSWRHSDNTIQAMYGLMFCGKDYWALMQNHGGLTRARILKYMAVEEKEETLSRELLASLNQRELNLLLVYLPENKTKRKEWIDGIGRALLSHIPECDTPDSKPNDREQGALAAYLHEFKERNPSLEDLCELSLHTNYYNSDWVCARLARLVLQAAERKIANLPKGEALLSYMLPFLFRLHPNLVAFLTNALPFESVEQKAFEAFRDLMEDIKHGKDLASKKNYIAFLARLVSDPLANSTSPDLNEDQQHVSIIAMIAGLFDMSEEDAFGDWRIWRTDLLKHIRDMQQLVYNLSVCNIPALERLHLALRKYLPRAPRLPDATESFSFQINWFQNWQQMLATEPTTRHEEALDLWLPFIEGLINQVKQQMMRIARAEIEFLSREVRPFLELSKADYDSRGNVNLTFLTKPEGDRSLEDVHIEFLAENENGLLPPGQNFFEMDQRHYPGELGTRVFQMNGGLRKGQDTIYIKAVLVAGSGYKSNYIWKLHLPDQKKEIKSEFSLDRQLPAAFEAFYMEVTYCHKPVVFITLSEQFGGNQLMKQWQTENRGLCIDLDALFDNQGKGQRYHNQGLLAHEIDAVIREKVESEISAGREKPILFGPANRFFARLLANDPRDLSIDWLENHLNKRAGQAEKPNWLFLVDSKNGSALRGRHLSGVFEVAAHRFIYHRVLEDHKHSSFLVAQIKRLVAEHTTFEDEKVSSSLEALGWDFRLIFSWLERRRQYDQTELSPSDHLKSQEPNTLLVEELQALEPMALIAVLLGARAHSLLDLHQLTTQMVSDEDFRSAPRVRKNVPKLLQEKGTYFTQRSLLALKAAGARKTRFRVQGFGSGVYEGPRDNFYAIFAAQARADWENILTNLSQQGFGNLSRNLFRTASSYRMVIDSLYAKYATSPPKERNTKVYRGLLGRDRFPLENLSMPVIARQSKEALSAMLSDETQETDISNLLHYASYWRKPTEEQQDPQPIFRGLFSPYLLSKAADQQENWNRLMASIELPVYILGSPEKPTAYIIWFPTGSTPDLPPLGGVVKQMIELFDNQKKAADTSLLEAKTRAPLVLLLGPGVETAPLDPERRIAILKSRDMIRAAWEGEICKQLFRYTRLQMGLLALSPFQITNALPAGSPVFVGREEELRFIKSRLPQASILIVGSRRVGKTSLLNQINGWALLQPGLFPIFVDLQGITAKVDFQKSLDFALQNHQETKAHKLKGCSIQEVAAAIKKWGKLPIFLFNEIDGLVRKAPSFLEEWRGINDSGSARFVMVGYAAIAETGVTDSPFYHFTQGTAFDNKAIPLYQLSTDAARNLLDQLETSELSLRWVSEKEKQAAHQLLLERSYCIPWVLQRYCHHLLEALDRLRKDVLSHALVDQLLREEVKAQVVWQYIDHIEFERPGDQHAKDRQTAVGFKLILFSLVRHHYFLGGQHAPINDKKLKERNPLDEDLSFTEPEAHDAVKDTMHQVLFEDEYRPVAAWFDNLDLKKTLRLLTLTLLLEPDPNTAGRYGFLLHILPLELKRRYPDDPTLDNLILEQAVQFIIAFNQGVQNDPTKNKLST